MRLDKTSKYQKIEKKFFKKHPSLVDDYCIVLEKLSFNPFDSSLKTHKLSGKLDGLYACSLGFEYRMLLTIEIKEDVVTLVALGSHDEVY